MTTNVEIRWARGDDAEGIAGAIRSGFDPVLLDLMIYGSPAVARFICEQVAARELGADSAYSVADAGEGAVGCAEVRRLPDGLFLNYIGVLPEARSLGLGRALFLHALRSAERGDAGRISLDVLDQNLAARDWYARLGFQPGETTDWWEVPLSQAVGPPAAMIMGYPQAQVCQERFGFSQFTVVTPSGTHAVGRLGSNWFRLTRPEALTDPDLGAALLRIDPGRRILALLRRGILPAALEGRVRLWASTVRLAAGIEEVIRRLGG